LSGASREALNGSLKSESRKQPQRLNLNKENTSYGN